MSVKYLSDGNPDGLLVGDSSADKVGFFGSVPMTQRTNPMQAMIQGVAAGQIINWVANSGAMANAPVNTTGQATVALILANMLATDFVLAVSPGAAIVANLGVATLSAAASNVNITLVNPTAANVQPSQNQSNWAVTAVRGMNVITANLSPANAPANSITEQVFTLSGTGAAATATVNSAGQVINVIMTAAGSMYTVPPTVLFTPAASSVPPSILTGTTAALPGYQGGFGATGAAVISSTGQVIGVTITNPGSGYTVAPTVTFIGGNTLSPGMIAQVNVANQAGLALGAPRVAGPNQIGITFINTTIANIAPTANVAYSILGLNELPAATPYVSVGLGLAKNATTANTANSTNYVITGLVTGVDQFVGIGAIAINANGGPMMGCIPSNNNFSLSYGPTATAVAFTPANEMAVATFYRPLAPTPISLNAVTLSPANVPANTIAEQVFTLPANMTFSLANMAVLVNKPTFTPGLAIVGARANTTGQLAINYMNYSTGVISPPTETYLFAAFNSLQVTPTGGVFVASHADHWTAQYCSITVNQLIDLQNELQQALQIYGIIKGG